MGKKRARGSKAAPAAVEARPSMALATRAEAEEDDRIDYTDQHGVHWVADAGTTASATLCAWSIRCAPALRSRQDSSPR